MELSYGLCTIINLSYTFYNPDIFNPDIFFNTVFG